MPLERHSPELNAVAGMNGHHRQVPERYGDVTKGVALRLRLRAARTMRDALHAHEMQRDVCWSLEFVGDFPVVPNDAN